MDYKTNKSIGQNEPQFTRNKIIIPCVEDFYTFEKSTYKEEILKDFIDFNEYNDIISKASRVMGKCACKKKQNDNVKIPNFIYVLCLISIILVFIYLIALYKAVTSSNGENLIVGSIICVSLAVSITFSIAIYNFCRNIGKFKTLDDLIKEDLGEYLKSVNEKYENNLKFKYDERKRWIECIVFKPKNLKNFKQDKNQKEKNIHHSRHNSHYEFKKEPNLVRATKGKHFYSQSNAQEFTTKLKMFEETEMASFLK